MMRIKVRKLALYLDRDHTSTSGQVVDVKYHILRVLLLLILVLTANWGLFSHPLLLLEQLVRDCNRRCNRLTSMGGTGG